MKEMILLFFYIKNGMIYKNIMINFEYYVENAQKIKRIVKAWNLNIANWVDFLK